MADDIMLAEATRPLSFALFLEKMKEPAAQDLVRGIKECGLTATDICQALALFSCCCCCCLMQHWHAVSSSPSRHGSRTQTGTASLSRYEVQHHSAAQYGQMDCIATLLPDLCCHNSMPGSSLYWHALLGCLGNPHSNSSTAAGPPAQSAVDCTSGMQRHQPDAGKGLSQSRCAGVSGEDGGRLQAARGVGQRLGRPPEPGC